MNEDVNDYYNDYTLNNKFSDNKKRMAVNE